ncbi:MAG: RNA methyltransferase [Nitrososphaerales archaeon]|nr:RNA methyltransferase [Nitrososphaerales archaeon]
MIPKSVSVTLVEPRYPVNVGHVARLVKNFGVKRLYLVNPKVDLSVATVYAAHAKDVLENAKTVSFGRLRRENQLLVATTAIRASRGSNVIRRTVKPERVSAILRTARTASIVFGRDTTGLTNEEISQCDVTTVVETGTRYRTLNIGHAVAIVLYLVSKGEGGKVATQGKLARELFAKSFYELAASSRMADHRVRNLREVGKRMAAASELTDSQLHLMTGVFRKATLALGKGHPRDSKT